MKCRFRHQRRSSYRSFLGHNTSNNTDKWTEIRVCQAVIRIMMQCFAAFKDNVNMSFGFRRRTRATVCIQYIHDICVSKTQESDAGLKFNTLYWYDMIRYDTIRYDTIRYDTIRHYTIRYDTIRYDTIRHYTIRYDTIRYDKIRYDTIRYDTIRYNTIQYDTIRYDTIRYDTIR